MKSPTFLQKISLLLTLGLSTLCSAKIIYWDDTRSPQKTQLDSVLNSMREKSILFANVYNFLELSDEHFVIVWGDRNIVAQACKPKSKGVLHGCFMPKAMGNDADNIIYHAIVHLIDDGYATDAQTGVVYQPNTFRPDVLFNEMFHAAQYAYALTEENYLEFNVAKGGRGTANIALAETETDFAQILSQIDLQPVQMDMINSVKNLQTWIHYFDNNAFPNHVSCQEWTQILQDIAHTRKSDPNTVGQAYVFDSEKIHAIQWQSLKTFMHLYPDCGVICRCSVMDHREKKH